jgi:hypothetical protein
LLAFGDFNPVQSTRPIFARPNTWDDARAGPALKDGCTTFVIPFEWSFFGHTGSPLVGLGYPSLAHATFEPHLAYWRKLFPELPPDEFNTLFNNVGVFVAGDTERPRRIPGTLATEVPMRTVLARGSGYPCLFSGARRDMGAGAYAVRWELPPLPAQVPAGTSPADPGEGDEPRERHLARPRDGGCRRARRLGRPSHLPLAHRVREGPAHRTLRT